MFFSVVSHITTVLASFYVLKLSHKNWHCKCYVYIKTAWQLTLYRVVILLNCSITYLKYLNTRLSRGVPMDPGRPSRTQLYSFGSDKPCGCSHHLSQWWHGILDIPVRRERNYLRPFVLSWIVTLLYDDVPDMLPWIIHPQEDLPYLPKSLYLFLLWLVDIMQSWATIRISAIKDSS